MERLDAIADVANMVSGSETVEVTCERCGEPFEYEQHYVRYLEETRPVPVAPVCPACREAERLEQEASYALRRFEQAMSRYRDGHLGSRLAGASFAAFQEGPHNAAGLKAAQRWLSADPRPNLLLVGPVQSGKSYLVARIRRGFTDREATVTANRWLDNAETAPVLVLDDLGKVHPGRDVSWVEETFYGIIEARYRDELPTVITTEWKAAVLAERVGESVVSRLKHGAWAVGLDLPPTPYRRTREVPR